MKKKVKITAILFLITLLCTLSSLTVYGAKLNRKTLSLYPGQTYRLKLTGAEAASFKSTKSSVASVNSKSGLIKAKKAGNCQIKVKSGNNTYVCSVTVKKSVELSKGFGSVAEFRKKVGYLRQATPREEPVIYTGTLYFGKGCNTGTGGMFVRTDKPEGKIKYLENSVKKYFTLYGVRLGDSVKTAEASLKKNGYSLSETNSYPDGHKILTYKKGISSVRLYTSSKNVVNSYQWLR